MTDSSKTEPPPPPGDMGRCAVHGIVYNHGVGGSCPECNVADPIVPPRKREQCGFCVKGTYSWDSGRRGPCPYCDGTGRQQ